MWECSSQKRTVLDEIVDVNTILLRLFKLIAVSFFRFFIGAFGSKKTHEPIRYHAHTSELASYVVYLHASEVVFNAYLLDLFILHEFIAHVLLQDVCLSLWLLQVLFLLGRLLFWRG